MENRLNDLIQEIKESLQRYDLKNGGVITVLSKHHRIRISPYRITLEIRFPEGILSATGQE